MGEPVAIESLHIHKLAQTTHKPIVRRLHANEGTALVPAEFSANEATAQGTIRRTESFLPVHVKWEDVRDESLGK